MRWAREVFADELNQFAVVCDDGTALDDRLDWMARQIGTSRANLLRTYLPEDAVRSLARQVATDLTGWDAALLQAANTVAHDFPEAQSWPGEVRNYLIDHVSTGAAVATFAEEFVPGRLSTDDLGLLRFRSTARAWLVTSATAPTIWCLSSRSNTEVSSTSPAGCAPTLGGVVRDSSGPTRSSGPGTPEGP
ncbi:MAG: hypothetical protein M3083_10085 [Actinomycetota bacterium]|nr:hypothetical protein [Actinomycetota bacterium]